MIRHTAVFRLKHEAGSAQEKDFLVALRKLKSIGNPLEQGYFVTPRINSNFKPQPNKFAQTLLNATLIEKLKTEVSLT